MASNGLVDQTWRWLVEQRTNYSNAGLFALISVWYSTLWHRLPVWESTGANGHREKSRVWTVYGTSTRLLLGWKCKRLHFSVHFRNWKSTYGLMVPALLIGCDQTETVASCRQRETNRYYWTAYGTSKRPLMEWKPEKTPFLNTLFKLTDPPLYFGHVRAATWWRPISNLRFFTYGEKCTLLEHFDCAEIATVETLNLYREKVNTFEWNNASRLFTNI